MRNFGYTFIALLFVAAFLGLSLKLEVVQDFALDIGAEFQAKRASAPLPESESLRVYVCGSASPLGVTDRAQACIAVLTPDHFYVIDSGAGSTRNLVAGNLPLNRLQGVFITHFHSDHIAEIYEVNLNSWVMGRPTPLKVYGPAGVDEVTNAVNMGYRQDRLYRTEHHGAQLLSPPLGVLESQTINEGLVLQDGELTVTAYVAEHPPIHPAVGYRFDYGGRSVVISGDSNVTLKTEDISDGVDLLLHDALSVPVVSKMSEAALEVGLTRMSKIAEDVIDYHASVKSLIELKADVGIVALYHLAPAPMNYMVEEIFKRDLPDNFLLAEDGMWFDLPRFSDRIMVSY
jgi:ribonuclease Z